MAKRKHTYERALRKRSALRRRKAEARAEMKAEEATQTAATAPAKETKE